MKAQSRKGRRHFELQVLSWHLLLHRSDPQVGSGARTKAASNSDRPDRRRRDSGGFRASDPFGLDGSLAENAGHHECPLQSAGWLRAGLAAGNSRIIRGDARLYFRRANLPEDDEAERNEVWKDDEPRFWDVSSEIDPEEGDYARVLQLINEFLPVKELAGRFIEVPVLRQFGLVDNEKVDHFLAAAFGQKREPPNHSLSRPVEKRIRSDAEVQPPRQVKK
jgi:hypothetical protein